MHQAWSRRGLLRGVVTLGAATGLAGCGFQPVYMPTATESAGPPERNMAAIEVALIPDRPGQLLRQALQARLHTGSVNVAPRYRLTVSYSIAGEGIAVNPDTSPTRIRLIGHANWSLLSLAPHPGPVTSGSARAFDGLNVFDQQFFAADLETEAQQRQIAGEIANQIAQQLAVYFRRRAAKS